MSHFKKEDDKSIYVRQQVDSIVSTYRSCYDMLCKSVDSMVNQGRAIVESAETFKEVDKFLDQKLKELESIKDENVNNSIVYWNAEAMSRNIKKFITMLNQDVSIITQKVNNNINLKAEM